MEAAVAGKGWRLLLRVSAYQLPDDRGKDFWARNFLTGEVELKAAKTGPFSARIPVYLLTHELEHFRDELQPVVKSLNGSAALSHTEEQVGCSVVLSN